MIANKLYCDDCVASSNTLAYAPLFFTAVPNYRD